MQAKIDTNQKIYRIHYLSPNDTEDVNAVYMELEDGFFRFFYGQDSTWPEFLVNADEVKKIEMLEGNG